MTLQFKIRGQTLYKLTPGDVVEGTQNYINCQFDFQTEDWEGCIKTALFQPPGGVEPYPVMLVDGTCTVPWEALEHPGLVSVSVFGVRDDYKITSSVVQFRNRATLTGGAATEPPTPTVYEQVLNDLAGTRQHATEQAQESKAAAGEAKGYAESAANTVDGFAAAAETASKAITAEGALQVSNIKSAGQTARQSVTAEGERQVSAVESSGQEALRVLQDAAAEIAADREQISTNKDNITSLQSEMRTKADAIVRTVSGESLLVQDSSDNPARGLRVFGKTTQDGTPTPDAPVPLVSVGDSENITVSVTDGTEDNVQSLTLPTPNGLPGIPVTDASLATYTDADGQMWCADEVDLERGVYVQRVKEVTFNGEFRMSSKGTFIHTVKPNGFNIGRDTQSSLIAVLCGHYEANTWTYVDAYRNNGCALSWGGGNIGIVDDSFTNVSDFNAYVAENPITVLYILATPIETPLTSDILSMYSMLHTNYPVTTVLNDAGAGMEMQYNADTQLYIDNKIAEVLASIANTNAQLL